MIFIGSTLRYVRFLDDFETSFALLRGWPNGPILVRSNAFADPKRIYVVQTNRLCVIERCILMATDPGDLVLDPTCGCWHDGICRRTVRSSLDYR